MLALFISIVLPHVFLRNKPHLLFSWCPQEQKFCHGKAGICTWVKGPSRKNTPPFPHTEPQPRCTSWKSKAFSLAAATTDVRGMFEITRLHFKQEWFSWQAQWINVRHLFLLHILPSLTHMEKKPQTYQKTLTKLINSLFKNSKCLNIGFKKKRKLNAIH